MTSIKLEKSDNIIHLIFDKENSSVNLMDIAFADDLANAVDKILTQEFDGIIVRSAKSTFFVGGDIKLLYKTNEDNLDQLSYMVNTLKSSMRQLETCGKPVVACINGSALGGGFELALACHHRIALNTPKLSLGLPEVTLGLLPGGGGVTRMVRLLGLQAAQPYLVQGKLFNPVQGQALTLIDELVDDESNLIVHATKWINNCVAKQTTVEQPWDVKGYKIPGGTPKDSKVMQTLPISPALIRAPSKGTLPAPEIILATMVEGAQVDFDNANKIESRYFLQLAKSQISKNLINTFWTQLNEIKAGKNRPQGIEKHRFTKVAVIGAGMMGAGIAYACAIKGIAVVLKDTSTENAEKGKDYSRQLLNKQLDKKRISSEKAEQVLALIKPSCDLTDLSDCEMVIEAVFENSELKAKITQECESVMSANAIFASNTSTLPISELARASKKPQSFIGLHFFSPVDKMQLIEIICGEQSSPQALALCYDISLQLGKTPIVVNDSRGFYTSRVFTTFVKEGIAMLKDAAAASIENAAYLNGFPVGPLAVCDEVSLTLFEKINDEMKVAAQQKGDNAPVHPADVILYSMIDKQRTGKANGSGFYQYPENERKQLWPELSAYQADKAGISLADMKDRLLFIMAIETVRCVEDGVIRSTGDANIGATYGIGYPQWTGGTLQFINQYGLDNFIERANQLANLYGDRFAVPKLLTEMLQAGKTF